MLSAALRSKLRCRAAAPFAAILIGPHWDTREIELGHSIKTPPARNTLQAALIQPREGDAKSRLSLVCTTYAKVLCLGVKRLRSRSLTPRPRRLRIQALPTHQFRRSAHVAHHLAHRHSELVLGVIQSDMAGIGRECREFQRG